MTPEQWRPKTALAFGLIKWSQDRIHTTKRLSDRSVAQKGDIVVFDFSHTGIVVEDLGNRIVTVEGNTNKAGSREGDGVYRKIRAKSLAQCFIRITSSTLS
jgi:signal peptidase I